LPGQATTGLTSEQFDELAGQRVVWDSGYGRPRELTLRQAVKAVVIANFKTWRCMHTDYRRPERTYDTAFNAVRALYFCKLRFA
jgi:hypothetical protein